MTHPKTTTVMGISSEVIKRALEYREPVITLENMEEHVLRLASSKPALAKMVHNTCMKHPRVEWVPKDTVKSSLAAIKLIIEGLEELDDESDTPHGTYLEEELMQVFRESEVELLVKAWNSIMVHNDWRYSTDWENEVPMIPMIHIRDGWMVRKTERVSMSNAILFMLNDRMTFITDWINTYTKTLYLNTSSEEWAAVLQVDPDDYRAMAQMNRNLTRFLMGE